MTTRKPIILGPNDGERRYAGGDLYRFLAMSADTDNSYGLWEAIVPPNGGPPPHAHAREEEGFYVIEGEIAIYIDGERHIGTPGTFVNMPKDSKHWFRNETNENVKMLVLVAPGGMENLFWETGVSVEDPTADIPPLNAEEKQRIIEAAPKFGITIEKPTQK